MNADQVVDAWVKLIESDPHYDAPTLLSAYGKVKQAAREKRDRPTPWTRLRFSLIYQGWCYRMIWATIRPSTNGKAKA